MTEKIGFIVDGHMEYNFFKIICKGKNICRSNCNGETVSVTTLVKRISSLARVLQSKNCSLIVILYDKEKRKEKISDLVSETEKQLANSDISAELIVGVADLNKETWILSDPDVATTISSEIDSRRIEGYNGKSIIKKYIPNYEETVDGVRLLKQCSPSKMSLNSPSFKMLYDRLQGRMSDCWWFVR